MASAGAAGASLPPARLPGLIPVADKKRRGSREFVLLINRIIKRTIRHIINSAMRKQAMSQLTANDLKTKGIAAIEAVLADRQEAIVSVRGKDRFVVMEIEQYHYLRECELEAALAETRADIKAGRFVKESPAAHVKRVKKTAA